MPNRKSVVSKAEKERTERESKFRENKKQTDPELKGMDESRVAVRYFFIKFKQYLILVSTLVGYIKINLIVCLLLPYRF